MRTPAVIPRVYSDGKYTPFSAFQRVEFSTWADYAKTGNIAVL
jgi:hypothetical protein